jgi:ArsR family transcriptional regulator, arsenate/arsenite/antimonite-responsive transcriptional repressor
MPRSVDPAQLDPEEVASLLKAMADPVRVEILRYLRQHGSARGFEIRPHTGLSQPTTSHHLRVLRMAGLIVRGERPVDPYQLAAGVGKALTEIERLTGNITPLDE